MKRIGLVIAVLLLTLQTATGQTAKAVLDKVATVVNHTGGVTAAFQISSAKVNASGTMALKGQKFQVTTPHGITWFDGKTQWTYVKQNEEVNVSTPTAAQLQQINPYPFINLYKKGYKLSLDKSGKSHEVHMKATNKQAKMQELYIVVDKKSYVPSQVRMMQGGKWTTINISQFKKASLADSQFRFNAKDYPHAEVIDLR